MTRIGIHDLELATAHHVLEQDTLAAFNDVDPAKYHLGLGQDEMSVPSLDEDIITMGAAAALRLIERNGMDGIRTILFATESGQDQSKAAGVWVHRLLGLPSSVRVAEFKQACYGGTAALQAAVGIVGRSPNERVLVLSADVAKYALDTAGEPTQGAGAVAMLVSADPAVMEIEARSGVYTYDVDDFWRPNDSAVALVDGALSVSAYLDALAASWDDLQAQGGPSMAEIHRLTYHQPFTKMAKKAQAHLSEHSGTDLGGEGLEAGAFYNRRLGNTYTASLFVGLLGLLDREPQLAGKCLGLFSYGSGSVSELLTGVVQPGYEVPGRVDHITSQLDARVPLEMPEYREIHETVFPSAVDVRTPRVTQAPFRFAGIEGGARIYERN